MQRSRDLTVHAGQLSNLWYLILTVGRPQENSAATVRDWLRDLLDDGTGDRMPIYAGVGSAADDRGGLPRSRKEAERALAVARLAPAPGARSPSRTAGRVPPSSGCSTRPWSPTWRR